MKKNIFTLITLIAVCIIMTTATFAYSATAYNPDFEVYSEELGTVVTFVENGLKGAEIVDASTGLVSYRTIDDSTPHIVPEWLQCVYSHDTHKTVDNLDGHYISTYMVARDQWVIVLNYKGEFLLGSLENIAGIYAIDVAKVSGFEYQLTSKHSANWASRLCLGADDLVFENAIVVLTQDDWQTPLTDENGRFIYAILLGEKFVPVVTEDNKTASDPEPASEQPAQKEEPAQEEPAQEEPAQEEPAQEEPAQEEPAQEEPAQEEPAQEEPAQEEPAQEEHVAEYDPHVPANLDQFHDDAFNNPLEAPEKPAYGEYDEHSKINLGAFGDSSDSNNDSVETYGATEQGLENSDSSDLNNGGIDNLSNDSVETYGATEQGLENSDSSDLNNGTDSVETYGADASGFANLEPDAPAYGEYDGHGSINLGAFGN